MQTLWNIQEGGIFRNSALLHISYPQDAWRCLWDCCHGQQSAPSFPLWSAGQSLRSSKAKPWQWCPWDSRRREAGPPSGQHNVGPTTEDRQELMLSHEFTLLTKKKTMFHCLPELSPCLWSDRSRVPHPWVGEGCQKNASRSWPGPLRVWLLFQPCSAQSGHRSGVHWGASSDGRAATSGQCCPKQTTGCGWPSSALRCSKCQIHSQHLRWIRERK